MNRRKFLSLTGTYTSGALLLPSFLHAFGTQSNLVAGEQCLIFIQLNGGNDGLNTFIPFENPLYYALRPKIALSKNDVLSKNNRMAFHPALKGFAEMQQNGDLSIIQNVGYPNPIRSHFRSQEIWQTAVDSNKYSNEGWLGKYLDATNKQPNSTAAINIDSVDNLALKGAEPNAITVKNPKNFTVKSDSLSNTTLSDNPQLDFVRKIANSVTEGADDIQKALTNSKAEVNYPKTNLATNLELIARLIKGNLNSKVYYTALGSFDTHDNQLVLHDRKLTELNDALFSFYNDLKQAKLLQNATIIVFSEFGRRAKDNGNGTDHGTAAPVFIIGGSNKAKIIGNNPDLNNLDNGDLKHEIDFRSVYGSLLQQKMNFDPKKIGINNNILQGLF